MSSALVPEFAVSDWRTSKSFTAMFLALNASTNALTKDSVT